MTDAKSNEFIDDFAVYPSRDVRETVDDLVSRLEVFEALRDAMPTKELIERGWITDADDIGQWSSLILDVLSTSARPLFRRAKSASEALSAAWLSRVSQLAKIAQLEHSLPEFEMPTSEELNDLVKLSVDPRSILELPSILAEKGIILVYERALKGMKLDGAVYRSSSGIPVIGISFRYPRIDNFWFTLLHELAHVRLHFEELNQPILEDLDEEVVDQKEREANRYAMNLVVPRAIWRNVGPRNVRSAEDVITFAAELDIHPALVAGLLQRRNNRYDLYRPIVDGFDTRELVFGG